MDLTAVANEWYTRLRTSGRDTPMNASTAKVLGEALADPEGQAVLMAGMVAPDRRPEEMAAMAGSLGVEFFDGIEAADPKFLTAEGLAFNVNLPPLFIVTCGDDFLEADNLALAAALARKGADFELFDPKPRRHETLGHVFVIGMPWLDESVECFERLRRFSYERC